MCIFIETVKYVMVFLKNNYELRATLVAQWEKSICQMQLVRYLYG